MPPSTPPPDLPPFELLPPERRPLGWWLAVASLGLGVLCFAPFMIPWPRLGWSTAAAAIVLGLLALFNRPYHEGRFRALLMALATIALGSLYCASAAIATRYHGRPLPGVPTPRSTSATPAALPSTLPSPGAPESPPPSPP